MEFFKATDGRHWYISIDGGETFEWCQREPFLGSRVEAPLDEVALNDPVGAPADLTLSRDQLEERGFTISPVTNA